MDTFRPIHMWSLQASQRSGCGVAQRPIINRSMNYCVWAEFSLNRKTSELVEQNKGTTIVSCQRKMNKIKIEPVDQDF
jgi:hypothetical protein